LDEREPPLLDETALADTSAPPEDEIHIMDVESSLSPDERRQRLLGQVTMRVIDAHRLEADLAELVTITHEAGATWGQIGEAAGISAQVARRKWNPVARRQWNDYQRRYWHNIKEQSRKSEHN